MYHNTFEEKIENTMSVSMNSKLHNIAQFNLLLYKNEYLQVKNEFLDAVSCIIVKNLCINLNIAKMNI